MILIFKKRLQFLNTLSFSLKKQVMFLVRHGLKINRTIIITNAIEVMNNPTFRTWLAMRLLPYKYVFKDIAICAMSTWMVGLKYHYITICCLMSASLPARMLRASGPVKSPIFISCPCMFHSAVSATLRGIGSYFCATINTRMRIFHNVIVAY